MRFLSPIVALACADIKTNPRNVVFRDGNEAVGQCADSGDAAAREVCWKARFDRYYCRRYKVLTKVLSCDLPIEMHFVAIGNDAGFND
ncbi:MAG TPA: hypothetical protein VF534_11475 [Paraburkholderia sp.]